ncbi:hypothetical protein HY993_03495 [Candidatus Micrarchaeota archaeon]|nr:hypothetical protein [Candidatus Micrarchaeota archaeon]
MVHLLVYWGSTGFGNPSERMVHRVTLEAEHKNALLKAFKASGLGGIKDAPVTLKIKGGRVVALKARGSQAIG